MPRINRKGKKNGSRTPTKPGQVYRGTCEPDTRTQGFAVVDGTNPPAFVTCKSGHRTAVLR